MNYQPTLNLPKTDFSMKANLAQKEPQILQSWEEMKLYNLIRAKSEGGPAFILHDGPPYANGHIHIGHAFNKILKDMIVKYKTLRGFDSEYVPGWDCHGLPIEHQLFKELKTDKSKVDTVEFRQKAHEFAMKFVGIQKEEFQRLGVFGHWDHPYLTLTPEYEYWILRSLSTLQKKGYIDRGLKPVNWCASCETALAEAEVEYEDHTSPSVYVKFPVNNPQDLSFLSKDKKIYLLIWTTTPWTLLANVAVAVHPDYDYVLAITDSGLVLVEQTLYLTKLMALNVFRGLAKEGSVKGMELIQLRYDHPFGLRKNCPVVLADYVTREDGTGLVHTAPGHGQEDFQTGLKYQLNLVMPVDDRGFYTEEAGDFVGTHISKANPLLITNLEKHGLLLAQGQITHSYPHCWRCKNPIIFRATKQWFLKIDHDHLREKLEEAVKERVQWIPPAGQERILGMIKTRPDWCLSRQRLWGVPIPALECLGCGRERYLFAQVIDHFAEVVKTKGSDVWFKKELKDLLPENFSCPHCRKNEFKKTHDILDVWFDSGVSHQAVFKSQLHRPLPADLYLEGSDQHRGWFQSSLIPAVAIEGQPPYRAVLTHGFVVDGQGRKMSKSLGNVIAPQDVIKTSGAEILRLWVASSNYSEDIRLSKEIIDRLVDAYRKIRNTFRFLLGNLNGFIPQKDEIPYPDLQPIDQWILGRLSLLTDSVTEAYDAYDFAKVYKSIYLFCNEDLSSVYLDILKDRLYTFPAHSTERKAAQSVLYHLTDHLVRLLSPILSFTVEEIFGFLPTGDQTTAAKSVHLLPWPVPNEAWRNSLVQEEFRILMDLRPHVLKVLEEQRRSGQIGSSLEAKVIIQSSSPRDLAPLKKFQNFLPFFFIVSQVELSETKTVAQPIGEHFLQTGIGVLPAEGQKCSRCWNYSVFVGKDLDHPTLCDRCVRSVKEILNAGQAKIG